MKTIHTRDFNNQGNKISCTVDVKDGKDVITSEVIEFRSKDEMNGRLKNILRTVNDVAEVFPTLTDGEWTAPVVKEAVVDKFETAMWELETKKRQVDLGLMTEAEYATEVGKVKALKDEKPVKGVISKG